MYYGGGRDVPKSALFNQITLITDGFSNSGISPIEAARRAYQNEIIVNVIGITSEGKIAEKGVTEIENIANSGGGLYQIVPLENVARTVQLVTRKAMNKTIQQVVHSQLTEILGKKEITSLPPDERMKVIKMMDNLAEYSQLNVHLLIDQSLSMLPKLDKVKEAIIDFQLSLQARAGESRVSIATFPGIDDYIDIRIPWTSQIDNIDFLLYKLNPKGNTPTGPAIMASSLYFSELGYIRRKQGVLDEYIV